MAEFGNFPPVSACMTCHKTIAADSAEIRALAARLAASPVVSGARIYRLPDFVSFRHGKHVRSGIQCAACHGEVGSEATVRPVLAMKMKACVECHQAYRATVSCTACHELSQ